MKYVLVLGYGWSGSSAVIDLLTEYDKVDLVQTEFRLIKDYGGLIDLRYHLVENWDQLNADLAIKEFAWFSKCLGTVSKGFPVRFGLGYSKSISKDYFTETEKYISKIAPVKHKGHWFYFDYSKSKPRLFKEKALRKLGRKKPFEEDMYYSGISAEQFDALSKEYINSLFKQNDKGNNIVILDQAVPTQNLDSASHFFDDYKIIVVDRDARDIYCDLVNANGLIGPELGKNNDVSFYKDWFLRNRNREQKFDKSKVQFISFEELINSYDETVKKIESFVGLNETDHVKKKQFFNPDVSKKNIGIWKNYNNQDVIDLIKKELPDYISKYSN